MRVLLFISISFQGFPWFVHGTHLTPDMYLSCVLNIPDW